MYSQINNIKRLKILLIKDLYSRIQTKENNRTAAILPVTKQTFFI